MSARARFAVYAAITVVQKSRLDSVRKERVSLALEDLAARWREEERTPTEDPR